MGKDDADRGSLIKKLKNLQNSEQPLGDKTIAIAALLLDDRLAQIQALLEAIAGKSK